MRMLIFSIVILFTAGCTHNSKTPAPSVLAKKSSPENSFTTPEKVMPVILPKRNYVVTRSSGGHIRLERY